MVGLFSLISKTAEAFKNLKEEIGNALLHVIEENISLVAKTDTSDTTIATDLNKISFRLETGILNIFDN